MDLVSDIGTLAKVLPNILRSRIHVKNSTGNFVDTWNNTVELNRDRIALQMNSRSLSFNDIQIHSNQFAHAFLLSGIRPKDVVCVMLENIPEFVIICLALSKIGAVGALINFNLREKALFHCIKIVNPVAIIFQDHFAVFIKQIVHNIKTDFPAIKFFSFDESSTKNSYSFVDIALSPQYIREFSNQVTDPKLRSTTNFTSPYLYIYTSGTTGLPKAATVTHLKAFSASTLFPDMLNVVKEDRVFCCLPLYHSSAFLISWGFAIHHGATLILSQKFSTSNFWKDVVNSEATVISYIGELARYLLYLLSNTETLIRLMNLLKNSS